MRRCHSTFCARPHLVHNWYVPGTLREGTGTTSTHSLGMRPTALSHGTFLGSHGSPSLSVQRQSIRLRFRRSDGSNRALARRHTHAESAARPTDAIPFGRLHVAPSARRARGAEHGYRLPTPAALRPRITRSALNARRSAQAPPFLHGAATRSPVHASPRSPLDLTSQKPP